MITKRVFSRLAALLGLVLILAITACGSGSTSASSTPAAAGSADTIVIKNFMFSPATLTVSPGTVVTVRNEDSVTHTMTDQANPKLFSTGDVGPGQVKTFKAPAKAGSYPFFCTIHQYMTGTLVVR
ncbi:MAG: cupredoxin domain-containing protein [Streptosporangiaceae bacterium]|jgi:plastocyanin